MAIPTNVIPAPAEIQEALHWTLAAESDRLLEPHSVHKNERMA
jgi:hypothetical protein